MQKKKKKKKNQYIGISVRYLLKLSIIKYNSIHRFIVYSLKSVVIVTECISDRNETNKRNSCLNLILFTNDFLGLCSHRRGGGGGRKMFSTLKISKTKNDLSMKLSSQKHVSFVSIVCVFSCLTSVTWLWRYFYDHRLQIM